MASGSNTSRNSGEFIGAYVDPDTKRRVERRAESEGKTVSDVVRRRLSDVDAENQ
jgi:guanylate kinase